jgi:hypothetical protein
VASERAILRAIDALTKELPRVEAANMAEVLLSGRRVVQHKNTVGVGMGYKIKRGKTTNQKCLQVYVVKKITPKSKLKADQLVPEVVVSGSEPVPTDVIEVGRVVPEKLVTRNPIQPGYSIGHINVTAGTFGALVTRGRAYGALSNSHVLAAAGKGKNGDAILYPGKADGGKPADRVAKLARFRPFKVGGYVNTVDAAVATFDKTQLKKVRSEIKNLGVPKGLIKKASLGMAVTKTGRTSATTKGKVIGVAARLQINYPGVGLVGFRDQVLCTRYSKPGDSGSLVLEQKSKKAVGLHFAGGPKGSFFNPIGPVLSAMGAKLVFKSVKLK